MSHPLTMASHCLPETPGPREPFIREVSSLSQALNQVSQKNILREKADWVQLEASQGT